MSMPMGVMSPGTVSFKKNIFLLFDYMRANNAVSVMPRSMEHDLVSIDFTDVRYGSKAGLADSTSLVLPDQLFQ